ncbi:MAG: hypothetical protein HRU27_21065 [Rhizobiaceae bacterium]|nr:hypothetical protein [Rhizobiaceae bacterium]
MLLSSLCYVADAVTWVLLYELATYWFLLLVLGSSSATGTRMHMALCYLYGVLSASASCLLLWCATGSTHVLIVGLLVKLGIYPMSSWLVEIHGQLPTMGSMLLSGVYVKVGWIGLFMVGCWRPASPVGVIYRSDGLGLAVFLSYYVVSATCLLMLNTLSPTVRLKYLYRSLIAVAALYWSGLPPSYIGWSKMVMLCGAGHASAAPTVVIVAVVVVSMLCSWSYCCASPWLCWTGGSTTTWVCMPVAPNVDWSAVMTGSLLPAMG